MVFLMVASFSAVSIILKPQSASAVTTLKSMEGKAGYNDFRIMSYIYYKYLNGCFVDNHIYSTGILESRIQYNITTDYAFTYKWFNMLVDNKNFEETHAQQVGRYPSNQKMVQKTVMAGYVVDHYEDRPNLASCADTNFIKNALELWDMESELGIADLLCWAGFNSERNKFLDETELPDKYNSCASVPKDDSLAKFVTPKGMTPAEIAGRFRRYIVCRVYGGFTDENERIYSGTDCLKKLDERQAEYETLSADNVGWELANKLLPTISIPISRSLTKDSSLADLKLERQFLKTVIKNTGTLPSISSEPHEQTSNPSDTKGGSTGGGMLVHWLDYPNKKMIYGWYNDQPDQAKKTAHYPYPEPLLDSQTGLQLVTRYNLVSDWLFAKEGWEEGGDTTTLPPPPPDDDKATSDCAIKKVGWMICPVVSFLSETADKAYGYLAKEFLVLPTGDDGILGTDTQAVWKAVLGVANIAFVVAFLVIIFSQLTSVGIDNYGIKKMLPKLIVAVILVNLSFYICKIGVDLSNIIGSSMNSFFSSLDSSISIGSSSVDSALPVALPESWVDGGEKGLSGITAVVLVAGIGGLLAALGTLIPIAIGAIVSIVMILLILAARKALIIILAVIAPIAFVAYLLPNTEKYYKLWQKTFMAMLLLYPITAFVFSASKLASKILSGIATRSYVDTGDPTDVSAISQILAAGVAVLPLFVVPSLLKKSLDGIAGIGNMVSKISSKADGWGKDASKKITDKYKNSDFGKYRTARKADIRARTRAGNYTGKNPFRKVSSRAHEGINKNRLFNSATGGFGANKEFTMNSQSKEDKKKFTEMIGDNEDIYKAIANGGFDEKSAAFRGLTKENQTQIRKMKSMQLDRRASTYLATAEYMGTNGLGDGSEASRAIQTATKWGADQDDALQSFEAVKSGYKKAGHAKALTRVHNDGETYHHSIDSRYAAAPTTLDKSFAKITPKDLSKFTFTDPSTATTQAEQATMQASLTMELGDYDKMLRDKNNLMTTLNQFSDMSLATQKIVSSTVLSRAQIEATNQARTKRIAPPPRFVTVQDAKNYFNKAN